MYKSGKTQKIMEYDLTATNLAPKPVIDPESDGIIVAFGGKLTAIGGENTKTKEDYKNLRVLADNGTWVNTRNTQPTSLTEELLGIIQGPVLYL